jgi:BolA protein
MTIAETMERKLRAGLSASAVKIQDNSKAHRGHAGYRPGGETHFKVEVVSQAFAGKTPIERHRMVYALLTSELRERVHALEIVARTPEEAAH